MGFHARKIPFRPKKWFFTLASPFLGLKNGFSLSRGPFLGLKNGFSPSRGHFLDLKNGFSPSRGHFLGLKDVFSRPQVRFSETAGITQSETIVKIIADTVLVMEGDDVLLDLVA